MPNDPHENHQSEPAAGDDENSQTEPLADGEISAAQAPQLSAIELRVLGALMEKQLTTPEQYPLTVNAIITACNQKSNRDPVSDYGQGEVVKVLQSLKDRHFVRSEYSSRADKFSQQFMHELELGKTHQAVLCLLMLRGPQTISELGTRTQRMNVFSDRDALIHCVDRLCKRDVPYAVGLSHQPGQRGERFGHLFHGMPEFGRTCSAVYPDSGAAISNTADSETMAILELEVAELNSVVEELKRENSALKLQIDTLYELTGHPLPGTPSTG